MTGRPSAISALWPPRPTTNADPFDLSEAGPAGKVLDHRALAPLYALVSEPVADALCAGKARRPAVPQADPPTGAGLSQTGIGN
jgi:hypothetical protein